MRYHVKAMRGASEHVSFSLDAASEAEAHRQVADRGFHVLSVKHDWSSLLPPRRTDHFPLLLFSQELVALLDAGLTLVEAIDTLAEKDQHSASGRVLSEILAQLRRGSTLSGALEQMPLIFPPLFVATVKASEKSGSLKDSLIRYIDYQRLVDTVRRKLTSASIYPLLLMGIGGAVTLFLLLYVVPRFSMVYSDIGRDLPLLSRSLIGWGKFLANNTWLVLVVVAGIVGAAVYGVTRPALRAWFWSWLWSNRLVGERLRIYELSRFYRTLGMLLRAGIPLVRALEMGQALLSPVLREPMSRATESIRQGQSVSQAMEREQLTTTVARRLLRTGEGTGKLPEMTERIAAFYEDEIGRWVEWFTRLFEPLLMTFIGLIIGLIVLFLYMPIFELAGSIQ